ncbi:MAG TPA: hypothetical protein VKZ70_07620, partial [Burkholderiaceae bacterium]|nr:hypothetical protein [Burkholderiaceae bacterium]
MNEVRLSVLVDDVGSDEYTEIVERCRRAGLVVENQLSAIGVIIGCIDETLAPQLRDIKGVKAVEREREQRG